MRILQIAAPAMTGGLETVLLELASGLDRSGQTVLLVAVVDSITGDHPVLRRATEMGISAVQVALPPRSYATEYRELGRVIETFKPDIVHTHGFRSDLIGGYAARRASVPWVSTVHGFIGGDAKGRFYEWLQVFSYHWAQAVVPVSRPLRDRLSASGVHQGKMHAIPNAWDPKPLLSREAARLQLGLPGNTPTVGWVGRLTREKGADVLLRALALLPHRTWRASIIGDGRDAPALKALAGALGIADRVHWHGSIPEAASHYLAFDAWVLSSRTEGTPMALFEAMSARVPLVVTSVGGVPDIVSPAEAEIVPSESPPAIAEALTAIFDDPEAAFRRSEAAYNRLLNNFGTRSWIAAYQHVYYSLHVAR